MGPKLTTRLTPHEPSGWLYLLARENRLYIFVTLLTSQVSIGWSKLLAKLNALCTSVTLPTCQLDNAWLKAVASRKVSFVVVTWLTSHALSGWLKTAAFWNVACVAPRHAHAAMSKWPPYKPCPCVLLLEALGACILVTWLTSHALMSSSKVERHGASLTRFCRLVMASKSQVDIWPYVAVASATSVHHSVSASTRLFLSTNADAVRAWARSSPSTSPPARGASLLCACGLAARPDRRLQTCVQEVRARG